MSDKPVIVAPVTVSEPLTKRFVDETEVPVAEVNASGPVSVPPTSGR